MPSDEEFITEANGYPGLIVKMLLPGVFKASYGGCDGYSRFPEAAVVAVFERFADRTQAR